MNKINFSAILQIALGSFIGIGLVWFYWPALVLVANQLIYNEDYNYGLLLPLVSGYLIYLRWPEIRAQAWRPSWMGLAVIAVGFLLYAFGELIAIFYLSPFSFLVVLTGLLWLLGGWGMVRICGFPLFLLYFMLPLPSLVMKQLTFPLQLISSQLAAGLLHLVGIPVVRQGNVIDLGVRQLQVVEACSGLRYILSLTALGMIYCYFYQRRVWKAAILLITLIPAAIIANALRVAAMGLYPALQEGFWHSFTGWLIFVFCFAILAGINWILDYLRPPAAPPTTDDVPAMGAEPARETPTSFTPYLVAALAIVMLCGPVALRISQAPPVPLLQSLDNFPLQLDSFKGQRTFLDQAMAEAVGADDYLDANFIGPDHTTVSLWIAFFQNQNKKRGGTIHSPIICLTGAGWKTIESKIVDIAPGQPVRYLLMEQGGSRMVVYYWYLQRGRWLASEFPNKFLMGYDGLVKRRNDGAIIRLITPVGQDVASARKRLESFSQALVPLLPKFIPQ